MRWHILKALLQKEFQRHVANRGGLVLAMLLIAAAVLLSVFAPAEAATAAGTGMVGGVRHCFIEYDAETPLVADLKSRIPIEFRSQISFRKVEPDSVDRMVDQHTGTGTIQVRERAGPGGGRVEVYVMHPPGEPGALAPYEAWLFEELRRSFADAARKAVGPAGVPPDPPEWTPDWLAGEAHARFRERVAAAGGSVPDLAVARRGTSPKVLDARGAVATGMVVFALYFACVYLLPTLNCEERERGVLLAQALSPASAAEILAAKFLFYPTAGIALAAVIGGVYRPQVVSSLFFWLSLLAVAGAFLGIGMTVAALARTQRAAFLGAMCYLLTVSMFLLVCSTSNVPFLPNLAVEFHGPRILHAALTGNVFPYHWYHLAAEFGLAVVWLVTAGRLFRTRGWQ